MTSYIDGESVDTFAANRTFSWRTFRKSMTAMPRIWLKRHRDRRELLNYLAADHRAAKDLGIVQSDAEDWAQRPFWQS
jgi:uncharacterized protein YjiS (DUF1127 family)